MDRRAVYSMAAAGVVFLFLVSAMSVISFGEHVSPVVENDNSAIAVETVPDTNHLKNVNGLDLTRDFRIGGIEGLTPEREGFIRQEIYRLAEAHPAAFRPVENVRAFNPDAVQPTFDEYVHRSSGVRNADINLTHAEYSVLNEGWAGQFDDPEIPGNQGLIGTFFVNQQSTITAHVKNDMAGVQNMNVRLEIRDFYDEIAITDTKPLTVAPGGTNSVDFQWTPQWVSSQAILLAQQSGGQWQVMGVIALRGFEIDITVESANDPDPETSQWTDVVLVTQLVDDAEGGEGIMSGDKGADTWKITDQIPAAITSGTHSGPNAWFCGTVGAGPTPNRYGSNVDARLISPSFDLTTYDTTNWYVMNWFLMAGAVQGANDGLNIEWSTDDGDTWGPGLYQDPGIGSTATFLATEWGAITPLMPVSTTQAYVFYGFPFFIEDEDADLDEVRFALRFQSGATGGTPGFYVDDFILMGVQITNDVGIRSAEVTPNLIMAGQQMDMKVEGMNFGMRAENNVFFNISLYEGYVNTLELRDSATPVHTASQTHATLGVNQRATKTFQWTPANAGLYTAWLTVTSATDKNEFNDEGYVLFHVNEGDAGVLVVDDEGMGTYGEELLLEAMDFKDLDYHVFTMNPTKRGPTAAMMGNYDMVIWRVGTYFDTLLSEDQAAIQSYLSGGGSVWLIGDDILFDLVDVEEGDVTTTGWVRDVLKVATVTHDVGLSNPLRGVAGDPITDGMSISTTGEGWGDDITPVDGATGIFQGTTAGKFAAIRDSSAGKLVFFAFDFNEISNPSDQANLVESVYKWLVGGVEWEGAISFERDIDPNAMESIPLTIRNIGAEHDTIQIEVTGPDGYSVEVPSSIQLDGGATGSFSVNITAPGSADASAGDEVEFEVLLTSTNAGKSPAPATIQLTVNEVKGLALSTTTLEQSGNPGDDIDFTFTVKNDGNNPEVSDTVTLTVEGDAEWGILDQNSLTLAAQGQDTVTLTVEIPDDNTQARAGSYAFLLRARIGTAVTRTQTVNVEVNRVGGVGTSAVSTDASADLRDTRDSTVTRDVEYTLTVANTGNAPDNFTLSLTGAGIGWTHAFMEGADEVTEVSVMPGQNRNVKLVVGVPGNANAGTTAMRFTATSQNTPSATMEMTLNATVKRPNLSLENMTVVDNRDREITRVEKDKTVTVNFLVKNSGTSDVSAVSVKVAILDRAGEELEETTVQVTGLTAGEERQGSASFRMSKDGVVTIRVIVDPDDNFKEISEDNNQRDVELRVDKPPEPTPFIPGLGIVGVLIGVSLAMMVGTRVRGRRKD